MTFDISSSERLQRYLHALAMLDLAELASMVSSEGESQTKRRINDEKTSPDGEAWPEWSEQYALTRHGGQKKLQSEGDLLGSIQADAQGSIAGWGSNLVYAAVHNFGGEAVGINVPAREYLGLSDENLIDIEHLIIDWVDRQTGESA